MRLFILKILTSFSLIILVNGDIAPNEFPVSIELLSAFSGDCGHSSLKHDRYNSGESSYTRNSASRRILNGQDALQGDFPSYARITANYDENLSCGGVILDAYLLLTVAHCFRKIDRSLLVVHVGMTNMANHEDTQTRSIESIYRVGEAQKDKYGDLAVMVVDKPFEFNANVGAACVDFGHEAKFWRKYYAIGMGRTNVSTAVSNQLKLLKLVVAKSCMSFEAKAGQTLRCYGPEQEVQRAHRGVCKGDSGSGLYYFKRKPDGQPVAYLAGLATLSNFGPCKPYRDGESWFTELNATRWTIRHLLRRALEKNMTNYIFEVA